MSDSKITSADEAAHSPQEASAARGSRPDDGAEFVREPTPDWSLCDQWLYHRTWERSDIPKLAYLEPTNWILFMDNAGLGRQISEQLRGAEHKVVEVSPGKAFARVGKRKYLIRPGHRVDYDSLIVDITKHGGSPQKIVHLWSVSDGCSQTSVEQTLDRSFQSLLYFAQALFEQDLSRVDFAVVSSHLWSVSGEPITLPVRASLLGVAKLIPKVFPKMTCRVIDCDPVGQGTSYVAVQIISEHCGVSSDAIVAYRGGERWVETLERIKFSREVKRAGPKQRGVYLITGGLGELGLAVAENFVRNFHARIALIDDYQLSEPHERQDLLQRLATSEHEKKVIRKLAELKDLGAEVITICADIARPNEMKRAFQQACQKFGEINGVVHAASFIEDEYRQSKEQQSAMEVFNPAIKGTLVLEALLREKPVDFLALLSLKASSLPPVKQIEYDAAAAFLDSFAMSRNDSSVVSINLPMCPGAAPEANHSISPDEAAAVVTCILSAGTPPMVTVAKNDLLGAVEDARLTRKQVPGITLTNTEDVEGVLLVWWQDLLGLTHVDLDDDFFELGGDSLLGVQLFSKIKRTYGVSLGLATLFETRTISQLAPLVRPSNNRAKHAESAPWSPLVPIQPRGNRAPLFVISGLGGNVIKFHTLAFYLGEDQPIYGLLPRGLDGKDSYHTRIEDMAADYVAAIRAIQGQHPFQLVGYSFGGIVAFEVAQQIIAQGGEVGLLGLFDTIEWHYGDKVDQSLRAGERLGVLKTHLQNIALNSERSTYIKTLLSEKSWTIKYRLFRALGRPLPQKFGSIEETNSYAATGYYPKVYPGKVTLFRSIQRTIQQGSDEFLGWGELTSGGVEVHHIPGTHFNILQEPGVKVLAAKLQNCLNLSSTPRRRN
jgi:thioesterase domain-containing protein